MMNKEDLEVFIYQSIPLTQAMGLKVLKATETEVSLYAPLTYNQNHKLTAFGGSLHSLATLACWSLIYIHLKDTISADIVITESQIKYLHPIKSNFTATCLVSNQIIWDNFLLQLSRRGKARIQLQATIYENDQLAVDYFGTFAALKK